MIRHFVLSLAVAGALMAPAAHALAAPTGASTATILPLACDNGQTYTIVTNSGNSGGQGQATAFSPGFILGGDFGKLLPLAFTFIGTDVTTNTILFNQTVTKGQSANAVGTVITCTFDAGTFPLPNGDTGDVSGSVTALVR